MSFKSSKTLKQVCKLEEKYSLNSTKPNQWLFDLQKVIFKMRSLKISVFLKLISIWVNIYKNENVYTFVLGPEKLNCLFLKLNTSISIAVTLIDFGNIS